MKNQLKNNEVRAALILAGSIKQSERKDSVFTKSFFNLQQSKQAAIAARRAELAKKS